MSATSPPRMRCDVCPGTTPCHCLANLAAVTGPKELDACRICETPIGWFPNGIGWRHMWPHASHPECVVASGWPRITHDDQFTSFLTEGHIDVDDMLPAVLHHFTLCEVVVGVEPAPKPTDIAIGHIWLTAGGDSHCPSDLVGATPWTQLVAIYAEPAEAA